MKFNFEIGNLKIKLGKEDIPEKPLQINGPSMQPKDYTYAPLKYSMLPKPTELKNALITVNSDPRALLDIIRKTPQASTHLTGLIAKRQDAFCSLDWKVTPHKVNAEDKEEIKRCEEINELLSKANFDTMLKQLVNATMFGHSATLPHWELDQRNMYYPKFETIDFVHFAKRDGSLKFLVDKSDRNFIQTIGENSNIIEDADPIVAAKLINNTGNVIFYNIKPGTLITASANPFEGLERNYIGGWMRPMLYLTLLLHFDIIDWARFNEMFGMPMRVGKYDSYSSDKAVEVLMNAVKNLGADASAVIDKSTEIEFKEAVRNPGEGVYKPFAEYVENKQSIAIRGETLTTEVSSTGGNRALGQVHMLVAIDKLWHDIKFAKPIVEQQIIERLYFFNFGEFKNGFAPDFEIYPEEYKDYATLLDVVRTASDTGLPISKARIYKELSEFIEEPRDEEDSFKGKDNPFNLM